jgi:toxin ParE1/3/4
VATKVILSNDARNDLDKVFLDLSEYSSKYAQLWADQFFEYLDILESNPKIGRIVPEIGSDNFREVLVGKYRMLYKVTDNVEIMMLRHSSRPLNS